MNEDLKQLEERVSAEMGLLDRLPAPAGLDAALARARFGVQRELRRRRDAWVYRLLPAGGVAAAIVFVLLSSGIVQPASTSSLAQGEAALDDWAAAFHDSGEQLVRQWLGGDDLDADEDPLEAELDAWGLSDEDDGSGA